MQFEIAILHDASFGDISPIGVDRIAADGATHDI